jgi:hypothetical protein
MSHTRQRDLRLTRRGRRAKLSGREKFKTEILTKMTQG